MTIILSKEEEKKKNRFRSRPRPRSAIFFQDWHSITACMQFQDTPLKKKNPAYTALLVHDIRLIFFFKLTIGLR